MLHKIVIAKMWGWRRN